MSTGTQVSCLREGSRAPNWGMPGSKSSVTSFLYGFWVRVDVVGEGINGAVHGVLIKETEYLDCL